MQKSNKFHKLIFHKSFLKKPILGQFWVHLAPKHPPPKKKHTKNNEKKQNKKQKQEDTLVKMQLCHLKYSQGWIHKSLKGIQESKKAINSFCTMSVHECITNVSKTENTSNWMKLFFTSKLMMHLFTGIFGSSWHCSTKHCHFRFWNDLRTDIASNLAAG